LSVLNPGVVELRVNSPAQLTAKDFSTVLEKFTALGL
jgi:hypothetical protein